VRSDEIEASCRDFDCLPPIIERIVKNGRILIYPALSRSKKPTEPLR
jgi:hypothetical protein